jgi:methyltransferase (TIGR00027 family)
MDETSRRPSFTALAVEWARRAADAPRLARPVLGVLSAGLVDHIQLRTRAIDAAVTLAVEAGAAQLVILGAGLDARAYRLGELRGVTVFEVDHPRSQASKLARVRGRAPVAARVVHLPVDFSHQRLDVELAARGHRDDAPTAWICEGVTPYLTGEQIAALLRATRLRSAPGSVIALTYRSSGERPFPPVLLGVVQAALRVAGEPLRASPSPASMAALLEETGFVVTSDTSSVDWAPAFGGSAAMARVFRSERLVVAHTR